MKFLNNYYFAIWSLLVVASILYSYNFALICPEVMCLEGQICESGCYHDWSAIIGFTVATSVVYNIIYLIVYFVRKRNRM